MINKILPRNLTARAAYNVPGNPPSTRPESGVANCYPGLEYDHRNLDRRFFPGLVFEFVSQGDATAPSVILNLLPWHGQSMVPSAILSTRQPTWVQTALNALNSPFLGWVTTSVRRCGRLL